MEASTTPQEPGITWVAGWGDQVKEGDLLRVVKLGGPVRIVTLRKFRQKGSHESDDWFYGAVVEDKMEQQFHLFVQPHEAVWIGMDIPPGAEGLQDKGEDDTA